MALKKGLKKKIAGLSDDERAALRAALDGQGPDDDDDDDDAGDADVTAAILKLTEANTGLSARIEKLEKLAADAGKPDKKKGKGLFGGIFD